VRAHTVHKKLRVKNTPRMQTPHRVNRSNAACNATGSFPREPTRCMIGAAMTVVVSAHWEDNAPIRVGSLAAVTRGVGPRTMPTTEEITELRPPKSWTVRGVGGPVAATAKGTIESLDDGTRSRVTIAFEFEAHGVGKLLLPLVVRPQVRRRPPKHVEKLKEVLERGG
jgi:carbon monoxide dehydrogenase subunit G